MEVKPGYKQTEVGVIPEEWDVKPLGELGSVVRGGSPRPAGDPRYFDGNFIPWLTVAAMTNISDHQVKVTETAGFLTEEGTKHSRTLASGTLIIANSGATLGVAKILGVTCCANDGIAAIINQRTGDKDFVCQYINTRTKHLREVIATGNGQPNLNTALIREILMPFPANSEQRAIATAFSDLDALLGALERLIVKKRDLKQATMQQLLTGQTRLPGFRGEWKHVRLGDLLSFKNGLNKAKEFFGLGTPIVNYMDVFSSSVIRASNLEGRVSLSRAELKNFDVREGDVFFTRTSETTEEIGIASVMIDAPTDTVFSGFVLRARPLNDRLHDSFKAYCFSSAAVRSQITSKASYTTRALTNGRILSEVLLHLPTLPEQTVIAAVLTDMDAELTVLEQRLAKTRSLKQGMMQELLTGRTRLI